MISEEFRRQLHQEAQLWQAEGLIDGTQYQQLETRYQFTNLETVAHNRFILVLLGVGSTLLGLGIITLVAAHWQALSREAKVTLLLSLFVGINVAGFYLWRQPRARQQRLGQFFLLLGALILGANMALLAQMFHVGGSIYGLLLAWGLGVLVMAYGLQITTLGGLALLLTGLGYWQGVLVSEGDSWYRLLLAHMPLLAGLLFVPLAYWCRSSAIFVLGVTLGIAALEVNLLVALEIFNRSPGWIVALIFVLPPALLWGYNDWSWPRVSIRFQSLARRLALLFLSILFYIASFYGLWTGPWTASSIQSPSNWAALLDVGLLMALTIFQWLSLMRQGNRQASRHGGRTTHVACLLVITAFVPVWHLDVSPIPIFAVVIFNGLLFLLASSLIYVGLAQGERRTFWSGMVLLTLQILSRLLEYETGLLIKSFVFLFCGTAVVVTGLWFERHLATLKITKGNTP